MSEGLQIQRYIFGRDGMEAFSLGSYCLFSEAEKFHEIAQEQIGKNLLLAILEPKLKDCESALKKTEVERDCLKDGLMKIMAEATHEQHKEIFTRKDSLLFKISQLLGEELKE